MITSDLATTAAAAAACRFCFEGAEPNNPLLTPCKCTGSLKYIHAQCIKKWRQNTTNYDWIHKCQLCLEYYDLLLRWPKEDDPRNVPFLQLLTKQHYSVSIMLYYFHLTILSLLPIKSDNPFMSPYSNLQHLYFTQLSYYLYIGMLSAITCLYFVTYYKSFWKYIKNKKLYTYLWFGCVTDKGIFQTPLMTHFMILASGLFSFAFISPFAFLYIYMLSSIYNVHLTIVRRINDNAELF